MQLPAAHLRRHELNPKRRGREQATNHNNQQQPAATAELQSPTAAGETDLGEGRERAVPRGQNPPISGVIISPLEGESLVLNNLGEMLLESRNITCLISEDDVVALRPNQMAKSSKREAGNSMMKLLATKLLDGPIEVLQPRSISPRQKALGSPIMSQGSRKGTAEKDVVNRIRSTTTKGANTISNSPIIQEEYLGGQSFERDEPQ